MTRDAIAAFLLTNGVTRCPTACAAPTPATITANDQQALRQRSEQHQIWQAARQAQLRHAWLVGSAPSRLESIAAIGAAARLEVANAQGRELIDRRVAAKDHKAAIAAIHEWFGTNIGAEAGLAAVGHRGVHCGLRIPNPC
jgi:hypothetical protein